jgi:hypothetical protein
MIKYFCDRCGKEIKDTMYTESDTTEAVDCFGNIVSTFTRIMHYCDECRYEELSCGFKVGDKVITNDGRTGVISEICTCETCKKRGFYEPTVTLDDGTSEYIMISDKENGFKSYYKIGDHVFGNLDEESIQKEMMNHFAQMAKLQKQYETIQKLKMHI